MGSITYLSRKLRNNPTAAERKLWEFIRNRQIKGYRFLRQKPIVYKQIDSLRFFIITDFICYEKKLIIEVDGGYHNTQKDYDQARDILVNEMGFKVLRFENKEVMDQIKIVVEKISAAL